MEERINEQVNTMPGLNAPAPEFTAYTTQGKINFPADYKGKWVILFSHPADFTPVCTSEFMTFASLEEKFKLITHDFIKSDQRKDRVFFTRTQPPLAAI